MKAWKSSQEATKVTQGIRVTDNVCLEEGAGREVSEKHLNSAHVLKVESTVYAL